MKVRIYVTLKQAVLDPQGKAVHRSLQRLGYKEVTDTRVGKYIELSMENGDRAKAASRVEEMCKKLLSNPLIEDTRYEFAD
ncbi:MAG TPA: phosphoribosylformylglycinamidine synthase subunit PurS [Bdellovibrionota bacterium]|nr:phosphoribosylformylglycinamidine synthase subunit PurS [Bdellovibrionota bacterium]